MNEQEIKTLEAQKDMTLGVLTGNLLLPLPSYFIQQIQDLVNFKTNYPEVINKEGFNNKIQELCNRIKFQ